MKKFFSDQKEIIAILAWISIIGSLVYFVILPLNYRINEIKDKMQEEQLNQQIARQQIAQLPKIEQQYKTLNANLGSVDVLLDKNSAVKLIERMENIADRAGVKIIINVQESQPQKTAVATKNKIDNTLVNDLANSNYLQFKISLEGKYNGILAFIDAVQNFEFYGDIIDIDIKKDVTLLQNQNSPSGSGVLNPFDSNKNTKNTQQISGDKLNAVIDAVFYTK